MYISNGLFAVSLLSNCLNEPAAAFLAFANNGCSSISLSSFILSNPALEINTSPRTIISTSSFNFLGICGIVFKFSVISSPTSPLPLVAPLTKIPFLYSRLTDKPSIFVSTTYFKGIFFSSATFLTLSSKSFKSSKLKISNKL